MLRYPIMVPGMRIRITHPRDADGGPGGCVVVDGDRGSHRELATSLILNDTGEIEAQVVRMTGYWLMLHVLHHVHDSSLIEGSAQSLLGDAGSLLLRPSDRSQLGHLSILLSGEVLSRVNKAMLSIAHLYKFVNRAQLIENLMSSLPLLLKKQLIFFL